ncbi:hypothetical protein ABPG74_012373 [Tetrahymena malaccensis]
MIVPCLKQKFTGEAKNNKKNRGFTEKLQSQTRFKQKCRRYQKTLKKQSIPFSLKNNVLLCIIQGSDCQNDEIYEKFTPKINRKLILNLCYLQMIKQKSKTPSCF